jgi:hypothetical protein
MLIGAHPHIAKLEESEGKSIRNVKVVSRSSSSSSTACIERSYSIDPGSLCSKVVRQKLPRHIWFIFEEMFQSNMGRMPMIKQLTPMTSLAIALFAGSPDDVIIQKSADDVIESGSDENDESSILKWKSVGIEMSHPGSDRGDESSDSNNFKVIQGVFNLRCDWNYIFNSRLNPTKYKYNQIHDQIINNIAQLLTAEDDYWMIPSVVPDLAEPISGRYSTHVTSPMTSSQQGGSYRGFESFGITRNSNDFSIITHSTRVYHHPVTYPTRDQFQTVEHQVAPVISRNFNPFDMNHLNQSMMTSYSMSNQLSPDAPPFTPFRNEPIRNVQSVQPIRSFDSYQNLIQYNCSNNWNSYC